MRCMVTGATGFIGSHLVPMLLGEGYRVSCLVRSEAKAKLLPDAAESFEVDVHRPETIKRAVDRFKPELIFHLATLYPTRFDLEVIPGLIESNVLLGSLLMEYAVQRGTSRWIAAGSTMQTNENYDDRPSNFYAATKSCFDLITDYYVDQHQMQACTLYIFDSYGPGDDRPKLLNKMMTIGPGDEPIKLSKGDQQIGLVHVEDICRGFVIAAKQVCQSARAGHLKYALPSASTLSLRDLAALIEQKRGISLPLEWGVYAHRPGQIMTPYSPYPTLTGWSETITITQGIERLL